ncbi:exodeoxyribonuclease III [Weissella coleopterorum]|uniref:Exodeoxyribonuclease III n=1 Tax=Weissella coleopterorum TaxID=2714949 RepID=A0A6G8AZ05_9LACO|nr:exodeoxyribonuclease III [Weissella coleopterorum]QIL50298.1 exodeoxyribonuclease III [Weissella coleopterorum]
MEFISWNIDSLNAAVEHTSARGEMTWSVLQEIAAKKPAVFAIQETKAKKTGLTKKQTEVMGELFPDYFQYANISMGRPGYAGTLMLSQQEPLQVDYPTIGAPGDMDLEGRIITLEFEEYFVTTVYTPNSGSELARLEDRQAWDHAFKIYLESLDRQKPVIVSGDFNVAHQAIDLKNPQSNHHSAGFTDEERASFTELLEAGFIDTFRTLNPTKEQIYTWWAQISRTAKQNNSGWRIDYYLASQRLRSQLKDFTVLDTGERRDHAPIKVVFDFKS